MTNQIKAIREQRGLTQDELARRTGTTGATISRLESGRRKLSQEYMESIAKVLSVDPGDLVGKTPASIDSNRFTPIVGDAAQDSWRVAVVGEGKTSETIPVLLPPKISHLSGSAYRVTDDHAAWLVEKGGFIITVPLEGIRKTALDGDIIVVRSKEGRMERTMVAKTVVDARGVMVDLGEGLVEVAGDNWHVGIVVATYREV